MSTIDYPLNNPFSYIRVQTNYYKKCRQPTINGDFIEVWVPWSMEMLKQDLSKSYLKKNPEV
ncbi:MAG: hypothetical protein WKF97_02740 [Chitinophagaceae bacterium]